MKKSDIVQVEVQLDTAVFSEDIIAALGKIEAAIYNLKDALCAQLSKDNLLSGISSGVDGATLLFDIGEKINWEKFASNIPIISDYIGAVKFAALETGLFTALLPKLSTAFLDVGDKAKEIGKDIGTTFVSFGSSIGSTVKNIGNATIEFGKLLAAKVANKAEDIAILALYAVDYVKALGSMIIQLASNTGTWNANTAAKVANTTAQWAQVAATTAWNGICAVGTAVTTAFGAAMSALTSPIGLTVIAIVALIAIIVLLVQNFDLVKEGMTALWEKHLQPLWDKIGAFIQSVGDNLLSIWNTVLKPIIDWVLLTLEPVVLTVINGIVGALDVVLGILSGVVGGILGVLDGLIQFIAGVFAGDWDKAWGGIVKIFEGVFEGIEAIAKGAINGIIWIINMLIGAIYSAIARVVNGIGGIVSGIGSLFGQEWGFSIPANPPQISYLAKGAVLPANKPFLAMVGDQRHGTNVEAPLATIQEAVALVMEDQFNGMMAGFEAVTARQEQILETLMGIEIGDTTIGQAAMRYNRKMAIIKGGT